MFIAAFARSSTLLGTADGIVVQGPGHQMVREDVHQQLVETGLQGDGPEIPQVSRVPLLVETGAVELETGETASETLVGGVSGLTRKPTGWRCMEGWWWYPWDRSRRWVDADDEYCEEAAFL